MEPELKAHVPNFLNILEEVLLDEEAEYRKKNAHSYRHNPSSAMATDIAGSRVGACMRAMWYKAKREPESNPRDYTSRLTSGFGNAIHTWLLEKLSKSKKINVIAEAPGLVTVDSLEKEVSFRLDGLITHKGEVGGLEIKTGQNWAIQNQLKNYGPKDSDILQVLSYFGTNPVIMWFGLLYFARDSGYRAEYHIFKEGPDIYIKGIYPEMKKTKIDYLSFPGIVAQWKALEDAVKSDIIPKRDYKVVFTNDGEITAQRMKGGYKFKSDFHCMYCPWQKTCWTGPGVDEDKVKLVMGAPSSHRVKKDSISRVETPK